MQLANLNFVVSAVAAALFAAVSVRAEQHTIRFENKCGKGTPQLIQDGKVLSTGKDFVSNGPFSAGIAYLQTGDCLFNGENCALLEMTLVNPTAPGTGSSTDISLIAPHAFNVPTSFSYFGGCEGHGATCDSANCNTAFFQPNDNQVQVQCENNNVNLLITFCGDATKSTALTQSSQSASSSVFAHSSEAASHSSAASHAASTKPAAPATSIIKNVASAPSSEFSSAASPASSPAAAPSASASRVPSCRANSARRRRSTSAESSQTGGKLRRHHARNQAAHRDASI
ncbi:hypothetical protein C8Q74DRAFT_1367962 [Fomes fomentarius]|nr:hypothetical protein C8Q74DRAFT_1367962 [Fomes fomentarius]